MKMDKYIYLVAQLPALVFDKPSYMTSARFLEEADKWMGRRDFDRLRSVRLMDTDMDRKQPSVVRKVQEFEHRIRQDLSQWRQAGEKNTEYKPSFPISVIKEGNPLEIEKKLLRLRWQMIESLEQGHHFDLDLLTLYYLKLQIQLKLAEYDKEKGMNRFQQISKGPE
jgi:hypothetical protein